MRTKVTDLSLLLLKCEPYAKLHTRGNHRYYVPFLITSISKGREAHSLRYFPQGHRRLGFSVFNELKVERKINHRKNIPSRQNKTT